jgi:hypothetical protein
MIHQRGSNRLNVEPTFKVRSERDRVAVSHSPPHGLRPAW